MGACPPSRLASLELLARVGELLSDALVVTDAQGKIRLVNSCTEGLFGYPRGQLLEQTVEILLSKRFHELHRQHRENYYVHPRTRVVKKLPPLVGRRKDGSEFPINITLRTLETEDGLMVVSAIHDTSTRPQVEREVRILDEIVPKVGAMIILWDRDARAIYVSPSVKRILAYEPADLLGEGWWDLSGQAPEERRREEEFLMGIARGNIRAPNISYERLVRHRDGEPRWILWQNARGPEDTIISVGQDITERKQTEEELRSVNQSLETLVNTAPAAIISLDNEGTVLSWNPEAHRLFGWSAEEVVGRFLPILPPGKRQEYEGLREQYLKGEIPTLETVRQRKDGRLVDIHLLMAPLRDARGNICGSMGVVVDITERKRLEEALRASEERYRTLAEAAQDHIFVVNRDDVIEYVNPFCARQLGYEPEEMVGRRRTDFFSGELGVEQKRTLDQVFHTAVPHYTELRGPCLGGEVWLGTRLTPLRDEAGEVAAVMGISRDLTERRRAEEKLRRSEERYRTLAEALPVGIRVVQNGVIIFANSADARLFGFGQPDEMIGLDPLAHVAEEDIPRFRECMEGHASRGEGPTRYEYRARKQDGTVFPAEVVAARIFYGGQPASLLVVQDLTERKRLKLLETLLPVCCMCGKVRDDTARGPGRGDWRSLEEYVLEHSNADFSHTFCAECYHRYRREQGLPPEEPPA